MLRENDCCCAESSESEQHSLHESGNLTLAENEVNLNRTSPPGLYVILSSHFIIHLAREGRGSNFAFRQFLLRLAILADPSLTSLIYTSPASGFYAIKFSSCVDQHVFASCEER